MKKSFVPLMFVLSLLLGSYPILSQTNESKSDSNNVQSTVKNLITVNPLKLLLYATNITYYRNISSYSSVGFGIQYFNIDWLSGYGLGLEYRFSPLGKYLESFYIAPNVTYSSVDITDDKPEPKTIADTYFSLGVFIGWQWFVTSDFAIGLAVGLDTYYNSNPVDSRVFQYTKSSLTKPTIRFDIGYQW